MVSFTQGYRADPALLSGRNCNFCSGCGAVILQYPNFRFMKNIKLASVLLAMSLIFASCNKKETQPDPDPSPASPSPEAPDTTGMHVRSMLDNMKMGNPSKARPDTTQYTNFLITKFQYSMSYNRSKGIPNWVSWHLNATWLGYVTRQDVFNPDVLPPGWFTVSSTNYSGSGFDKGHHCPSADRTFNTDDNAATFLMTNMLPQAPVHNQTTWSNLENYCRKLVSQGNELYIVMGSYGIGGTGSNGKYNYLAGGRITIPERIWKVILVLPNGADDISRVTTDTRIIAVDTPNSNTINSTWGSYRTSVDSIEAATGYDFFSNLPVSIQKVLEANIDKGPTQ